MPRRSVAVALTSSFDAVVCRLGVMLFPDPGAAIHEMLRVVKRGGQMSVQFGAAEIQIHSSES